MSGTSLIAIRAGLEQGAGDGRGVKPVLSGWREAAFEQENPCHFGTPVMSLGTLINGGEK